MIEWIEHPAIKWVLPFPVLAAMAPLIWLFFRSTWRQLEDEALTYRRELHERGQVDFRPAVALVLGVMMLVLQEYYGRSVFYHEHLRAWLREVYAGNHGALDFLERYDELLSRLWWALTRVGLYLLPLLVWPLFFRQDSILDMGLRGRGFLQHAWLYGLFVVVMIPILYLAARQPDFGRYYPLCDTAGRSWLEFAIWETAYIAQFLALEIFFRGWWLRTTRSFGVGAIFCMVVPYVMIHYGKPYLETTSAAIAGAVLGSLSMKTRSIWAGFLVHSTVAITMDIVALGRKKQLPSLLTPTSKVRLHFPYWDLLLWGLWAAALVVLLWTAWTRREQLRAAWAHLRRRRPAT